MKTQAHQGKRRLPSFKWASLFLLRHKRHLRGRCLGNRKLHCPPLTTSCIPPPCLKRSVAMKFDWFLSLLMMGISCHITMMFMMIILSPFLKFLLYFFFPCFILSQGIIITVEANFEARSSFVISTPLNCAPVFKVNTK